MKTFSILFFTLLMVTGTLGQSCLPQGIEFTTQAQIDNFQTNYPNCTQIEGNVSIMGNDITNLNGLNEVTFIGLDLTIDWNDSLTSLAGLDNLTSIGRNLNITHNDVLTDLSGLNSLTTIGWCLTISSNYVLTNLSGLNSLTSIGKKLEINNNNSLNSLTGLNNVISIGDYLWIDENDALTSITGLNNVTSIGSFLTISGNSVLTNLTGLNSLTSVAGYLWIIENDSLTSLSGLHNVNTIEGDGIFIEWNPVLTTLTGLDNIDAGSIKDLRISNNDALFRCEVQSICDYLVSPNGTIEIHDNANGCNSQQEVELACGVGMEENNISENQLNIYPNPSSDNITIETPTNGNISILNLNGKELLQREITEPTTTIDVRGLTSGIYIVKVIGEKGIQVGKFVKQ